MSGLRRRNSSIRVTLMAVLLGATTTGAFALSSAVSPATHTIATDDGMQQLALLEPTPPGDQGALTSGVIVLPTERNGTRVPGTFQRPPTTTTTAPPTTTTTKPAPTTTTKAVAPTTTTTTALSGSQAQQVFELVNENRQQAGCAALKDDSRLDTAAQDHSDDMAQQNYFSHTTPAGETFDQREKAAGYPSPGGENIAMGQTSAQQVMTDWMNSEGHRANILNCQFTAIGIGVDTNGWYWTQDFGY